MIDIRTKYNDKLVTIDGTTLSLTGWAIALRVSRQRAHRLYHDGLLEERVRAKKKLSTELYEKWVKSKKAQRLAIS